jgi:ATP/ADP translocase
MRKKIQKPKAKRAAPVRPQEKAQVLPVALIMGAALLIFALAQPEGELGDQRHPESGRGRR